MLHFPSQLADGQPGKRTDSLNATQHIKSTPDLNPFFLKVEEELHDARRVQSHGQEDDLRMALSMVIDRVSKMSNMLAEAYRTQADLEVQLNVTKSNLKLVISNNEMLEEALKQDSHAKSSVGWRRGGRSGEDTRPYSADFAHQAAAVNSGDGNLSVSPGSTSGGTSPVPPHGFQSPPAQNDSRFFRFRFSSRPATPTSAPVNNVVPPVNGSNSLSPTPSPTRDFTRELEDLQAQLEKEKAAREKVSQEKTALEAELESLSQALFEEANKMVKDERIKLAEAAEELEQERMEKAALKSAIRVIEVENQSLRSASAANSPGSEGAFPPSPSPLRTRTISDLSLADGASASSQESNSADPSLRTVSHSRSSSRALSQSRSSSQAASHSRSSSRAGLKSRPSSRSSSVSSRRGIPEPLNIPSSLSSEERVTKELLPEGRQDDDTEPDSAAPETARPRGNEEDPDKTVSMPGSSSVDSGIEAYHTPELPPSSPWPARHAPSPPVTLSL